MMDTLSNILGMQIEERQNGIFMCQHVYKKGVLERFKVHEANPVATHCKHSNGGTEDLVGSGVPYCETVGCLRYLMTGTRPDIAFLCCMQLKQWIDQTRQIGLMSNVSLKYLRRTSNYGLLYGAANNRGVLRAFSDAHFAGDIKTRWSMSGMVAVYAGTAIAWSSQL